MRALRADLGLRSHRPVGMPLSFPPGSSSPDVGSGFQLAGASASDSVILGRISFMR